MKKFSLVVLLLVSGVLFSACTRSSSTVQPADEPTGIEAKQGDTTKTGVLVKQGEKYYIKSTSGAMEEVDSYAVDFRQYENKAVSATGQYSGDTLFVGSIIVTE